MFSFGPAICLPGPHGPLKTFPEQTDHPYNPQTPQSFIQLPIFTLADLRYGGQTTVATGRQVASLRCRLTLTHPSPTVLMPPSGPPLAVVSLSHSISFNRRVACPSRRLSSHRLSRPPSRPHVPPSLRRRVAPSCRQIKSAWPPCYFSQPLDHAHPCVCRRIMFNVSLLPPHHSALCMPPRHHALAAGPLSLSQPP